MSFSKNDLDLIKSKTNLVSEFEKKTKLLEKERTIGVAAHFMKKKLHLVK